MAKFAVYVPLAAKPGKEAEVADFLKSALPLVEAEPATVTWYAIEEGSGRYAIFDTFDDEVRPRGAPQGKGRRRADGEGQGRRPLRRAAAN